MTEDQAAALFHVLSHADRLKVLKALVAAGPKGLSAGALANALAASPSRTSFHLAALTDAGVLARERQGKTLQYRVNLPRIGDVLRFLLKDCCRDDPTLKACCR